MAILQNGNQILVDSIKKGNEEALRKLYREYRPIFINWAKKNYQCMEADAIEIFQDTMIIFYRNIKNGQLTKLESSPKTYLFGIAKKLLLNKGRKSAKTVLIANFSDDFLKNMDILVYDKIVKSHLQTVLNNALNQLGENCQQLLKLFYFQQFGMEAIRQEMNYKTAKVARTQKARCLSQLRVIVTKEDVY